MIKSEKIILRPFVENDLDFLFNLRNDTDIQFFLMTHPRPNPIYKVKEWVIRKTNDPEGLFFIISDFQNLPAGFLQISKMHYINKTCELGIALSEQNRGKGYFKESVRLIEDYLYNVFSIGKVMVYVLMINEISLKAFKRMGYEQCGLLKDHYFNKGKFYNTVMLEKILRKTL